MPQTKPKRTTVISSCYKEGTVTAIDGQIVDVQTVDAYGKPYNIRSHMEKFLPELGATVKIEMIIMWEIEE